MDPNQSPTQQPLQTPPEVIVPHNRPNWILIILSILSAILLVTIVFLSLQNQKLQQQILGPQISPTIQSSSPTPKTVTSISVPPDETAGWKTYTDIKYNYSFGYPQSWLDKTDPNDKNLGNFTLESSKKEMVYGVIFTGPPDLENDKKNDGSSKSFVINETKYLFVSYTECAGQGCNLSKKHLDTFNQILSTFKFVDDRSVCVPTYQVEADSTELTAKQNYSMRCTEQRSEKDCFSIDLYNQNADDFSIPDGIPDCTWKNKNSYLTL